MKNTGAIFGSRTLQCFVKGQGNGVIWILISMFLMEYVFKIHGILYNIAGIISGSMIGIIFCAFKSAEHTPEINKTIAGVMIVLCSFLATYAVNRVPISIYAIT